MFLLGGGEKTFRQKNVGIWYIWFLEVKDDLAVKRNRNFPFSALHYTSKIPLLRQSSEDLKQYKARPSSIKW